MNTASAQACVLTLLFFVLSATSIANELFVSETGPTSSPTLCPDKLTEDQLDAYVRNLEREDASYKGVMVSVGVDVLGRVAGAIDTNGDTLAEVMFLFTDNTRLEGPWHRILSDARVKKHRGSLLIVSKENDFGIALSTNLAKHPNIPRSIGERFNENEGAELVWLYGYENSPYSVLNMDYSSMDSWPPSFAQDLLATTGTNCPQPWVCFDEDCVGGGAPSGSCGVSGCQTDPPGCNVGGCVFPPNYACCKCDNPLQSGKPYCRCQSCECPNY